MNSKFWLLNRMSVQRHFWNQLRIAVIGTRVENKQHGIRLKRQHIELYIYCKIKLFRWHQVAIINFYTLEYEWIRMSFWKPITMPMLDGYISKFYKCAGWNECKLRSGCVIAASARLSLQKHFFSLSTLYHIHRT